MNPTPQLPTAPDIPLHDIKPLVEISDYSLTMLIVLIVVGLIVLAGASVLLWRLWKRRNEANARRDAFEALEAVDFADAKHSAYAITKQGLVFADDSARCREAYDALVARLAPYKYKKSVEPIDDETVSYYQIYLGMIDV
jgi:type II secretory pathway pseudopilin PulG